MSAGPRLSRLAAKDVRALAPIWIVCLAAMAASVTLNLTPFRGFGVVLFFFGLAALGALSFGHEYQHGTMALLLSLPAQRTRLFLVKVAVLAPMLLTVAAAAALLVFPDVHSAELDRPWLAWRAALYVLCVAPWLTMVFRSAIAGAVFTLSLPGTAVTLAQPIYFLAYGRLAPGEVVLEVMWRSSLALSAIGAVASWRTFARLEAIDGKGSPLGLPRWLRWPDAASAPGPTIGHPIWLLVKKELRLQEMAFVVAGLYVIGWIAAVWLQPVFQHSREIFDVLSFFYAMLIALLVGSVASAEERQLGTLDWQMLLPVGSVTQWAVKAGVVLGLALLFGLGLPALLVTSKDFGWMGLRLAYGIVALAIAGLYVSSTCRSGLWSMLMALSAVLGTMWWLTYLRLRLSVRLDRIFYVGLVRFDNALEPAMATVFLALLLWFAFANHRSADRASRRLWLQALWLGGYLTAATIAAVLAGWTFTRSPS